MSHGGNRVIVICNCVNYVGIKDMNSDLVHKSTTIWRRLKQHFTGAYNRRYLELQARKCLETWDRYQRPVSLLLLDIDHFKWINDKFGHAVGDEAIQGLVNLVKKRMRKGDILCRFGGEEFVLLLSESNGEQAMEVANEMRLAVERADILPEGNLTVSIGVCDVSAANDPEHWLKYADAAMYLAKFNGRNRVELADPDAVAIGTGEPASEILLPKERAEPCAGHAVYGL